MLVASFAGAILLATFLLMLPQAAQKEPVRFIDALFTITSATCVTGLTVVDTGTTFTPFRQIIILVMIQLGGLGFVVIFELLHKRKQPRKRLSLHAQLVVFVSALLIFGGMALLLIFEYGNTFNALPWSTKLWSAYFQSVTARTAGFYTINIGALSDASLFLLIMLMFIGASPGSCGGGIKTTTFAIFLAIIKARFHNFADANLFGRRIPEETSSKAIAISFFSMTIILFFTLLLLIIETQLVSHQASRGVFLELLKEEVLIPAGEHVVKDSDVLVVMGRDKDVEELGKL